MSFLRKLYKYLKVRIFFSSFFNASVVGYLSFAQKLLGMPMSLIARSTGDVFRQEATVHYNKNKECINIYKSTFKKLFIISILPFSFLFLFAPIIFSIVFGENWIVAGEYAQVLMPMYFLQFLASPLGNVSVVSNKPKIDLYWQLFLIFIVIFSILISYYIFNNSFTTVFLFSLAYSLSYLLNLLIIYKLTKGNI